MSELNYLEKLLDGAEVEWLSVSEIFNLKNGYTPSRSNNKFWENGDIPWFRMDDIRENGRILDNSLQKISRCAVKGGKLFEASSILISTSATIGEHALIMAPHLANQRFTNLALKPHYRGRFDIKFLFYYCFVLADWCKKNTTMSSFASVDMDGFKKFLIPIPCPGNPEKSLAIQSEIVRILDTFTALTAELTAELTARKKQYDYYRDQLLSFNNCEVEWKTLREIGTWYGGGTPSKARSEFWEEGSIPWISPKDMGKPIVDNSEDYITEAAIKESSTKLIPANSIAIVVRSSILDKYLPSALIPVPATFNQDMKIVITHGNILPGFIAHMLRSRGNDILRIAKKTGGSVASIDSKKLFSFRIPIPKQYEQQRITNILDKFDTLANSLTEGLPREIELRQKQYEYYSDLLFSFPKPESVNN